MILWTRRRSILLAAALGLATMPYLVAYVSALANGGFVLIYQTETTSRFSYFEHIWIGRLLYGVLCIALITAMCAIERRRLVAAVALLTAVPILLNDKAGAVFDFFGVLPWTPTEGPSFELFYNELKIPEQVWYVVLAVAFVSTMYCVAEEWMARRNSANKLLQATREDARA